MKAILGWSAGAIAALIAVILLVVGAVALVIWLMTASSGARGSANVTRQHNSGANQVAQNTALLNDWNALQADIAKIQVLAHPVTEQDVTNLQGAEQVCISDATTYTAEAASILASGYLPAGQPSSAPVTLCEVTAS